MKIKLLYFGRPREILNTANEMIELPLAVATLAELLAWLRLRGDDWAKELTEERVRCAINQEMATLTAAVCEQDEVAFFSPISGG